MTHCPVCVHGDLSRTTVQRMTPMNHDGRVYQITVDDLPVLVCERCGAELHDRETHTRSRHALTDHLGLLRGEQIARLRGSMKQSDLAAKLGIAPETISRWENGHVIQSRAHDVLLRVFFTHPVWFAFAGAGASGDIVQDWTECVSPFPWCLAHEADSMEPMSTPTDDTSTYGFAA